MVMRSRLLKAATGLISVVAYRWRTLLAIALFALGAFVLLRGTALALDPVGTYDQTVYANEDYVLNLTFKTDGVVENLTGSTFKLQCKKTGAAAPFVTYSSTIVNAAGGQTRHWLTRATTRANANTAGSCDLMQTNAAGKISYRIKGTVKILETVTR